MAKDNRVIHSGVVLETKAPEGAKIKGGLGTTTYVAGMEDELEMAMTPEQVKHLTEMGAISGTWHGKGMADAEVKKVRAENEAKERAAAEKAAKGK